jgi:shikimate kinase
MDDANERREILTMTSTRHVVLVGLMGSGKTTVGRLLADRLDRTFVDNDVVLERQTGRTARAIAVAEGADALHLREAEALVFALSSNVAAVIAAAAAARMEPFAAAAMSLHDVVYLRVMPPVLAARIAGVPDDRHRPFVAGGAPRTLEAQFAAQFAARDERYRALATVVVDAGEGGPEAVVDEISSALAR